MSEITVKRMDAAIEKIIDPIFQSCLDLTSEQDLKVALICVAQDSFLAGMKAGAKTIHPARHDSLPAGVDLAWAEAWDDGHDCHASAITAAIKRLKRELK